MLKKTSRRSKDDKIFDIINFIILTFATVSVIYPLYFIIIASFSDPNAIVTGQVWLIPKDISFEGYKKIFSDSLIWIGYRNSLFYTIVGTFTNVVFTLTAGYALSRKDLKGRNIIMFLFTFTMFFGGGLIPTYLVIKDLGMINTVWAMIIPKAVDVFNLIIAKSYFEGSLPPELLESAKLDGCSNARFFWSVVLPLTKPLMAIMILFYAIGHWNSFFDAMIYLRDESMHPLQLILRKILIQNQVSSNMMFDIESFAAQQRVAEQVKYGVIIVSSLPVLILYPFLQKYFVKGMMIGSIKG